MTGYSDLLKSERGAFCIAVLVLATMLTVIGKITGDTWVSIAIQLAGLLVASKTITNHINARAAKQQPQVPTAEVVKEG